MKARLNREFKILFFYGYESDEHDCIEIDDNCVAEFAADIEYDVLAVYQIADYASGKGYVIADPNTGESVTVDESFIEIIEVDEEEAA
ncbi:hypothetical protein D3C71_1845410 [compost metagenome]